jgi:cytoskeleton protein RodZ
MSHMDQQDKQQEDEKHGENGRSEVSGVGALLRGEREKRCLGLKQVSEKTRLRGHIIEALENEAWEILPPAVFVRGFIRAYARTLGLDEKRALDLYENAATAEPAPPRFLLEPRRTKGWRLSLGLVLLCIAAGFLYLWSEYSSRTERPVQQQETPRPAPGKREIPPPVEGTGPHNEMEKVVEVEKAVEMEKPVHETAPELVVPDEEVSRPEEGALREGSPVREGEQEGNPVDEVVFAESIPLPVPPSGELVLQGDVRERTWVRIYVDDQEPKEYIFQPGSRPQWRAREGFRLVIGNAAGVGFEFNGKRFEDLGKIGQVVRLTLPSGYQSSRGED